MKDFATFLSISNTIIACSVRPSSRNRFSPLSLQKMSLDKTFKISYLQNLIHSYRQSLLVNRNGRKYLPGPGKQGEDNWFKIK